jgi:hypothetical protein
MSNRQDAKNAKRRGTEYSSSHLAALASWRLNSSLSLILLLWLSGIASAALQTPRATIEGTVTRAGTGQPLKGAKVTLSRATTPARNAAAAIDPNSANLPNRLNVLLAASSVSVDTDANGRFTITGIDPGDYRISADREGFIRSEYGQRTPTGSGITIKLAANQRFTAALQMVQASVISGRVITPDGDPAPRTSVQAYAYRYSSGQRTLGEVATAQTNDLGEYRLFGLEPGEYFVSVTSPELADQTPVGTVDISQRRGAGAGRGGADVAQTLGTIAAALGERGGAIAQVLGGTSNPPVYYPGTLDPDGATVVPVGVSAETRGIDFNLRPSRAATITGRVAAPFALGQAPQAGGRGARGGRGDIASTLAQVFGGQSSVQVNLNRIGSARTGREGLIGLRLGNAPVSADGSFEIKGVAPGPYNLTATGRDANGQEYTAKTRVDVGAADIHNVVLSLRSGAEVQGKVVLEGAPPQQFKMTNLRVSLVAEDGALPGLLNLAAAIGGGGGGSGGGRGANAQLRGGGQLATEAVAEDGTFILKNVGAQEYRLRVTGLPPRAYIQSGRIGSSDALNAPFSVDNAQALLQLQLGFSAGRVTGAVADSVGNAAAGAQVVLVPDEARRGRNDAYFTAISDQNGQFTLSNVPPGNYKLFAWEDIPAGAYQYPDFLRRYEERGQSINVNPNGTVTANAKLIPAS